MQRIGIQVARLFKTLAGQDRDEPMASYVIGLYTFLSGIALMLVSAWVTGMPLECAFKATC